MQTTNISEVQSDTIAIDDLFTVEELAAAYPKVLTVATLRWHIYNRKKTGFDVACVKGLGRKLLISKSRFERWLASQTESRRAAA